MTLESSPRRNRKVNEVESDREHPPRFPSASPNFWPYAIALRLRGRVGVGVSPRVILWREPSPAALFERVDLPRKRERCSEFAARPIQPNFVASSAFEQA